MSITPSAQERGFVYVIAGFAEDTYKIGNTRDINQRLSAFLTSSCNQLSCILLFDCGLDYHEKEREAHRTLKPYRVTREFFKVQDIFRLRKILSEVCNGYKVVIDRCEELLSKKNILLFKNGRFDMESMQFQELTAGSEDYVPRYVFEHDYNFELSTPIIDKILMQRNHEDYICFLSLIGALLVGEVHSYVPLIIGQGVSKINEIMITFNVKTLPYAEDERKIQHKIFKRHIPFRVDGTKLEVPVFELGHFYIKCIQNANPEPILPLNIKMDKVKFMGSRSRDVLFAFMNKEYNEDGLFQYQEYSWTKWDLFKKLIMKHTGLNARQVKIDMKIWNKFGLKIVKRNVCNVCNLPEHPNKDVCSGYMNHKRGKQLYILGARLIIESDI